MRSAPALTSWATMLMFVATPFSLAATITVNFNGLADFIDDRVPQNFVSTFLRRRIVPDLSLRE